MTRQDWAGPGTPRHDPTGPGTKQYLLDPAELGKTRRDPAGLVMIPQDQTGPTITRPDL